MKQISAGREKVSAVFCVGFPICPSDNNHFTSDRSLIATERSVTRIMNNSETGNWKLYRANFTSQVITINGARSVWHFSRPVYPRAACEVDVNVCSPVPVSSETRPVWRSPAEWSLASEETPDGSCGHTENNDVCSSLQKRKKKKSLNVHASNTSFIGDKHIDYFKNC